MMIDDAVIIRPIFSPHIFILMPKDTRDPRNSLCHKIVLMVLQMADEEMLKESSNAVYLKMKKELDEIRWVPFFLLALRETESTNVFLC